MIGTSHDVRKPLHIEPERAVDIHSHRRSEHSKRGLTEVNVSFMARCDLLSHYFMTSCGNKRSKFDCAFTSFSRCLSICGANRHHIK